MTAESLARWQFAITTVYHFMIVPISIGMTVLVASFQTAYYRTRKPEWDIAARFYGKLVIVLFAIGVATGIVQEFQFGMNWSNYSRFVGDVFGAPLAMEGLVAFFLESTFLGCGSSAASGCRRGCTWPASGCWRRARSAAPTSSWPPTPGCSTRSAGPSTPRPGARS
jgi:hypothetical protein